MCFFGATFTTFSCLKRNILLYECIIRSWRWHGHRACQWSEESPWNRGYRETQGGEVWLDHRTSYSNPTCHLSNPSAPRSCGHRLVAVESAKNEQAEPPYLTWLQFQSCGISLSTTTIVVVIFFSAVGYLFPTVIAFVFLLLPHFLLRLGDCKDMMKHQNMQYNRNILCDMTLLWSMRKVVTILCSVSTFLWNMDILLCCLTLSKKEKRKKKHRTAQQKRKGRKI